MPLLEVVVAPTTRRRGHRHLCRVGQAPGQDGDRGQRRSRLLHLPDPRPLHERGRPPARRRGPDRGHRPGDDPLGVPGRSGDPGRRGGHRRRGQDRRDHGARRSARGWRPARASPGWWRTGARDARTAAGSTGTRTGPGRGSTRRCTTCSGSPRAAGLRTDQVQERLYLHLLNEAARCLEEGVLRSARDGDVGAVFGLGYPPFRGGPFTTIDRLGAAEVVARLKPLADGARRPIRPRRPAPHRRQGRQAPQGLTTTDRPPRPSSWPDQPARLKGTSVMVATPMSRATSSPPENGPVTV